MQGYVNTAHFGSGRKSLDNLYIRMESGALVWPSSKPTCGKVEKAINPWCGKPRPFLTDKYNHGWGQCKLSEDQL